MYIQSYVEIYIYIYLLVCTKVDTKSLMSVFFKGRFSHVDFNWDLPRWLWFGWSSWSGLHRWWNFGERIHMNHHLRIHVRVSLKIGASVQSILYGETFRKWIWWFDLNRYCLSLNKWCHGQCLNKSKTLYAENKRTRPFIRDSNYVTIPSRQRTRQSGLEQDACHELRGTSQNGFSQISNVIDVDIFYLCHCIWKFKYRKLCRL